MTVNEAIKIVEDAVRWRGLNLDKIDRLEIIKVARKLVKAQGNDPHVPEAKVIAFPRNTQR